MLLLLDEAAGFPEGEHALHEITESYIAGLNSSNSGVAARANNGEYNAQYEKAHKSPLVPNIPRPTIRVRHMNSRTNEEYTQENPYPRGGAPLRQDYELHNPNLDEYQKLFFIIIYF
ncbi:hypothetical protein GCM10011318_09140 [Phaeocystidibacter marisrubri]|nr:hypothetical protein GCM10011318_09140 [Phaeocystidibacter marisrubri]